MFRQAQQMAEGFQSTHPLRGATGRRVDFIAPPLYFNPRTPCGVRLQSVNPSIQVQRDFNPRTPCGVRQCHPSCTQTGCPISIHAPLAGCDLFASPFGVTSSISIHAPLAGCDTTKDTDSATNEQFQSTHPLRGATLIRTSCRIQTTNFNPRTPCGVRLFLFYYIFI